jgi:hypothetical protein
MDDDLNDSMRVLLLEYDLGRMRQQNDERHEHILRLFHTLMGEYKTSMVAYEQIVPLLEAMRDELTLALKSSAAAHMSRGLAMLVFPSKKTDDLVCSICASDDEPMTVHSCTAPLNCHHLFHTPCLQTYFETSGCWLCPLCKQ